MTTLAAKVCVPGVSALNVGESWPVDGGLCVLLDIRLQIGNPATTDGALGLVVHLTCIKVH